MALRNLRRCSVVAAGLAIPMTLAYHCALLLLERFVVTNLRRNSPDTFAASNFNALRHALDRL
jgi:hypothetical protein